MGENDKKEEKKDKLFCKRDIGFIIVTLLGSIGLIFLVAELVRRHEGTEWIGLEAWLSYYGSICGAIFGGCITAIGLYITFKINANQLKEQRKIDNARWENSNKQFSQQMKIQIINEKINDYKCCIDIMNCYINIFPTFIHEVNMYNENLQSFIRIVKSNINMDNSYFDNYNRNDIDKAFNLKGILKQLSNMSDKMLMLNVNWECIESYISRKNIKTLKDYDKKINESWDKLLNFNKRFYQDKVLDEPYNYKKESYKELVEVYPQVNCIIDEFMRGKSLIENQVRLVIALIEEDIANLYKEKYSLSELKNEQNMSNNN